ncbi:MAG: multi-sensor hybrid histidine kinase, partial [Acidobacteria bacterium]|nr:multi-sensor hybrid histidine kinase [Acidobacteriota bacterium]
MIDPRPPEPERASRLDESRASFRSMARARRKRGARESLHTTIAILRAQQEAMLDGILVVDLKGNVLSYNRRFLEIWSIPESVASHGDDNELLGFASEAVADWDAFIELVNYLYVHPEEARTGDPVVLKDGRILVRASVPVISEGRVTGRAWYFRDATEQRRSEVLQSSLFRIADLSRRAANLDDFYAAVHRIISELMDATNFYVAEYDEEKNVFHFPYFVDQFDPLPVNMPPGHGLTAYVLRTGHPLLAKPRDFARLVDEGEVTPVGAPSLDWLGVPLKTGDRTWGVMGVQSYDERTRYTEKEKDILIFVSQHVASAIEQRRKEEALRDSERRYR